MSTKISARKQGLMDASDVLRLWAGMYKGDVRAGMLTAADVVDPRVAVKPSPGRWLGDCAPPVTADEIMKVRGGR